MGRTNIHRSNQLLTHAGRTLDYVALAMDNHQLWYIVNGPLSQHHLDRHAAFLRTGNVNTWLEKDDGLPQKFTPCDGDRALPHPGIAVSPGLQVPGQEMTSRSRKDLDASPGPQAKDLIFVLVIQGQTGDAKAKVILETSREKAAVAIMSEAMNGYSTVFSAAMLKVDVEKLTDLTYALRVFGEREKLGEVGDGDTSVKFWCDERTEVCIVLFVILA